MIRYLPLLLALSTAFGVQAQQARVQKFTAPRAGTVVLKDVEDKYTAQVYSLEAPEPDADIEKAKLREIKQQVDKLYPRKITTAQYKTTSATPPAVVKGFVPDSLTGIPPDNEMAVSKNNKGVSVLNSRIAVVDANSGAIQYRVSLKPFSIGAGLNKIGDYRYDPKVIYDPEADRFICIMLNNTDDQNYIVIGFSMSNDPAGTWSFYTFYGNYDNDTTWFDYPAIAITEDEFFFTGNKIKFNTSWQTGFSQTVIYQVKKKDGYDSAANVTYQIWDNIKFGGKPIRNLYPVKNGFKQLHGPAQYFLSNRNFDVQNDTIFLVKVPDVISSGNTNLTVTAMKSPVKYGVPPNGRQPDTAHKLATNDGRILGAYAQYGEIQFVSTSVNTVNGASGVYHGVISNYQSSPSVKHAQIFSIDTLDFGYPNIVWTGAPWGLNQSLISFNYTGPDTYPGVGAILFSGIDYSPLVKIKGGDSSIVSIQADSVQRWGDYMGAQPDYTEEGSAWVLGIYGRPDNRYGNWMAKLQSPLLSVEEREKEENDVVVYPNPSSQFIQIEFELKEESATSFMIYNTQGQIVDKVLEQQCKAGKNYISFNVVSLPAGTYFLKLLSGNGEVLSSHRFVKQ